MIFPPSESHFMGPQKPEPQICKVDLEICIIAKLNRMVGDVLNYTSCAVHCQNVHVHPQKMCNRKHYFKSITSKILYI